MTFVNSLREKGVSTSKSAAAYLDGDVAFEYACIATHPKEHIGSVTDHIVRNHKGNIIVFKGEKV